MFALCIDAVGC